MLSADDVIQRLKNPVNTKALQRARQDERRHTMHVRGERSLVEEFLAKIDPLETSDTHRMRLRFSRALSKTVFSQVTNLCSKCFTMQGTNYLFRFTDDQFVDDFRQFLESPRNGQNFYQFLHAKLEQCLHTGFAGLLLVDLPPTDPLTPVLDGALPEPFIRYINSDKIYDLEVVGHAVTFCVLQQEKMITVAGAGPPGGRPGQPQKKRVTEYYVFEPDITRVFEKRDDKYVHQTARDVINELGEVPLYVISDRTISPDDDVQRTSHIEAGMELADMLLSDHSDHEMNKKLHAYMEKWSYGTKCPTCSGDKTIVMKDVDGGRRIPCGACNATGRIIPVGPDRIYVMDPPRTKNDIDVRPPAGYIDKDLAPTQYLQEQIDKAEDKIPRAIFSREGIVSFNTKVETAHGKELDMQSVYDKLRQITDNIERVARSCINAMARLRYGDRFLSSAINYSRNYGLLSVAYLEKQFQEQKAAQVEDNLLVQTLRELIAARYRNNPDLQARELLKLDLVPFPSMTIDEVQSMTFVREEDKRMKIYFNEYLQRFEREEADLLVFGSLLSYREKVQRIKDVLFTYNAIPNEQESQTA